MSVIPQKLTRAFEAAGRIAGLTLALVFHAAWLSQPIGWPLVTLHVGLVILSVVRPKDALLVLAGLAPLTTTVSILFQSPRAGWCLLVAMLWAVATGLLVRNTPADGLRLKRPAILLSTVTLGSATVAIAGHPAFILGYPELRSAGVDLISGRMFEWRWPWIPLHLAVTTSLALFTAFKVEQLIRRDREVGIRLVRMLIAGHAGAVSISLARLSSGAFREQDVFSAWMRLLAEIRYYSEYDVNAAASTLVILAGAGLGLAAVRRHTPTSIGVLFILIGVWLTGSRAALVAFIGVLLARPLVRVFVDGGRRAWMSAVATTAAVAIAAAALYVFYPAGRNVSTSVAYESRMIMLRTAWRAGLSDPLFGVGTGSLPERAGTFGSTEMERFLGRPGLRENAHNQYLQVFAETGALGVVALALLLGSVGWRALWMTGDPFHSWMAWGLLASLITWLLGHPLLVLEAAVVFWLALGIAAGLASPVSPRRWSPSGVLAIALTVAVVIATPLRAWQAPGQAALEHQGLGVSAVWQHDDAFAYRSAAGRFSLFLPSARVVALPLRTTLASAEPVVIEILLRGKLINRVETFTTWRQVRILLPESDRQFERLDFVVVGADEQEGDRVRVGKTIDLGRFPAPR